MSDQTEQMFQGKENKQTSKKQPAEMGIQNPVDLREWKLCLLTSKKFLSTGLQKFPW